MGLLDDAIREHLDLKRRSGGDPAEIARAEQEALAPVRREAEPDVPAEGAAHHDAQLAPQEASPPQDEPAAAEEHHDVEPAHDEADSLFHDPAPESHAEAPALDPRHSDIVHQPTTEFRVEDHHDDEPDDPHGQHVEEAAPHATDDEDVLEETPDFLQETPEHDRLWFEQRPPRDFDFDG